MNSFIWAENVKTDDALRPGEFASARSALPSERRLAGAPKGKACNTLLFRECKEVRRLIIWNDAPQRGIMTRLGMETKLRRAVDKRHPEIPDAFSASIFATALALVPDALDALRDRRREGVCTYCNCILKDGGPLDRSSPLAAFARSEVLQREALKEARNHGA